MNFQVKNYIFKQLEKMPYGDKVYYFFQSFITKSLKIKDDKEFQEIYSKKVARHLKAFSEFGTKKLNESRYYEFGAGWDLLSVLGLSISGMGELICIDLNPFVHANEIKNTIDFYKKNAVKLGLNMPQIKETIDKKDLDQFLKRYFRIDYRAPYDARNTFLDGESIDYIGSNVTLEHIPKKDIEMIMKECFRILRSGGGNVCYSRLSGSLVLF